MSNRQSKKIENRPRVAELEAGIGLLWVSNLSSSKFGVERLARVCLYSEGVASYSSGLLASAGYPGERMDWPSTLKGLRRAGNAMTEPRWGTWVG